MATSKTTNGGSTTDSGKNPLVGVMDSAQEAAQAAADAARSAASTAAERLPGAVSTAQEVAAETAQTLEEWPDQALVVGTSFSLGLAVGLFLSGSNRLMVGAALLPAAAMAATLVNRGERGARSASPTSTAKRSRAAEA